MKRISIWVCALGAGFAMTTGALAQPNIPVFSLWVTDVRDPFGGVDKCGTNCPTQNVPLGIAEPGDILTVEAYVRTWDAAPGRGFCDGDPIAMQNGPCTNIGSPLGCTGMHCTTNGTQCSGTCGGGLCVPNICQSFPRVAGYTWTILAQSFTSGSGGQLTPYQVPCDPDTCEDPLDQSTCACAHGHTNSNDCTCAVNTCNATTNLCGFPGTAYVEKSPVDGETDPAWLFNGKATTVFLSMNSLTGDIDESALVNNPFLDGVADTLSRKYLGTILLQASPSAAGIFTVTFIKNFDLTLVADPTGCTATTCPTVFASYIYQDLIINLPITMAQCSSIVSAMPMDDCDTDGRQPSDIGSAIPQGTDTIDLILGAPCDASTLIAGDFSITVPTGGAVPTITNVAGSGNVATLTLNPPIPPRNWTCISRIGAPAGNDVCVGFLSGDVDDNLTVNAADYTAAITSLNSMTPLPLIRMDTNRSGMPTAEDLVRKADLDNGGGVYNVPPVPNTLPACPP